MYRSRYIRVFVSSTFEDMQIERNILQDKVFPEISRFCEERGWHFEDIDLRWGVSQEASRKQKTMQICLNEIKRCQELSPKPNFLILQGDRYGWIPIPERIPYAKAKVILGNINSTERKLFEEWYRHDANALEGGEYILQERTGKHLDYNVYQTEAEEPLRKIFKRFDYNTSATEQEIIAGLYDSEDADKHVMLYSRHLTDVPSHLVDVYDDSPKALFGCWKRENRMKTLKKRLKEKIRNKREKTLSYNEMLTEKYAEDFEKEIFGMLKVIVENEINIYQDVSDLQVEREKNEIFIKNRSSFFIGRESFLEDLYSKIDRRSNIPIIVTGEPGCGKSSILAKLTEHYSQSMNVIARFVGNTFIKSFGNDLLKSIWDELNEYIPTDKEYSESEFYRRLSTAKVDKPLLIVIDGLDQIQYSHDMDLHKWMWLPKECAENVMIICSVARDMYTIHWQIRKGLDVMKLEQMDENEASVFVKERLKHNSRTLSQEQHEIIMRHLSSSSRQPIYLTLLSHYLSGLHSYDTLHQDILGDPSRIFKHMLNNMASSDHGVHIIAMMLSMILNAMYGVSQNEMREVLVKDDKFKKIYLEESHHKTTEGRVPSVLIIRVLNDLEPFLYYQYAFDQTLITFNHKTLSRYVNEWLQDKSDTPDKAYILMYEYFKRKWREGNLHAIYEMPSKAISRHDFQLFMDLDFTIMKIWKGASDYLRGVPIPGMANEDNVREDMHNYTLFDAEASAYVRLHGCRTFEEVKHAVSGLAAGWKKGSVVRNAFEKSEVFYPSMINTIANKSVYERMFMTLPFEVNDSAVISDEFFADKHLGRVIWNNNGYLYSYAHTTSFSTALMPEHMIDDFRISDDFKTIVAVSGMNLLVYELTANKSRNDRPGLKVNASLENHVRAFQDLHIHKRTDNSLAIAFKDDVNLYVVKCDCNYNITLRTCLRKKIANDQIVGFLKDGDWIVLKTEIEILEDGKIQKYKDVNAYDLTNDFQMKGGCRHRQTTLSYWKDMPASSCGKNLVISSSSNEIAICDFSGDQMQMRTVQPFNQRGRCSTYALHLSSEENSFWALSGDARLVGFNLTHNCIEYVVNMPSEGAMFKASANNSNLLLSFDRGRGQSLTQGRRYNKIMCVCQFLAAPDYFPSMLTTLSVCPFGNVIASSNGADPQLCVEGANILYVNPEKMNFERKYYDAPEAAKPFMALSTAISRDGKRFVFAKGPLVELCDDSTRHIYRIPPRTDGAQVGWPESEMWSFISRMEYTPDSSAILALCGRSTSYKSSRDGYLFVTGGKEEGHLKHVIDLPKDRNFLSFTYSNISLNGAYALLWSGNYIASDYMGVLVDLRNNKIISRMESVIGLKFYPDSKAFVETIITKLPSNPVGLVNKSDFAAGYSVCVSEKSAEKQKIFDCPDTEMGDIAGSGRFELLISHQKDKGSKIFMTYAPQKSLSFDEHVHACRITYDDIFAFVICNTVIYLVNLVEMKVVQKFKMHYATDKQNRAISKLFTSHHIDKRSGLGNEGFIHNSRHFQLYSRGLVISDWDRIFRIEPDGFTLNVVSFATISRVYDHRTGEYDVPKAQCPICGHRFAPEKSVIDCINNICKDLEPEQSPCLHLEYIAWETPELKGHKCPHCASMLRYNPFIG